MILIIDNYDSFVHNLARYVRELGHSTQVVRNDCITVEEIQALKPKAIILSPGPCSPNEAGICCDIVQRLGADIPILGICLGHQAIGQAYGAEITTAKKPMHGKSAPLHHNAKGIFLDLPTTMQVARYHSLIISNNQLPSCLEITATSAENEIMAVRHTQHPVIGLQFHPESVLTEHGYKLLQNFL